MAEKKYYIVEYMRRSNDLSKVKTVVALFSGERAYNMSPSFKGVYIEEPYGYMTLSQVKVYYPKDIQKIMVTSKDVDEKLYIAMEMMEKTNKADSDLLRDNWSLCPHSDNYNAVIGSYIRVYDNKNNTILKINTNGTSTEKKYFDNIFKPYAKKLGYNSYYEWGRLD